MAETASGIGFLSLLVFVAVSTLGFGERKLPQDEAEKILARLRALRHRSLQGHFVLDRRPLAQPGRSSRTRNRVEMWASGPLSHFVEKTVEEDGKLHVVDEYADSFGRYTLMPATSNAEVPVLIVRPISRRGTQIFRVKSRFVEAPLTTASMSELSPLGDYLELPRDTVVLEEGCRIRLESKNGISVLLDKKTLGPIESKSHGQTNRYFGLSSLKGITFACRVETDAEGRRTVGTYSQVSFDTPNASILTPDFNSPNLEIVDSRGGPPVLWEHDRLLKLNRGQFPDAQTLLALTKREAVRVQDQIHRQSLRDTDTLARETQADRRSGGPFRQLLLLGSLTMFLLVSIVASAWKTLRSSTQV